MDENNLLQLFNQFLTSYNSQQKDAVWKEQSSIFQSFWINRIMVDSNEELNDNEVDDIIKILDRNGKGNTHDSEAVAKAMIAQGAWRRMFNEIKIQKNLKLLLNRIFTDSDTQRRIDHINQLYKVNEKNRNNLTGASGNAVSCMIAAWDPFTNLSIISLKHKKKILSLFDIKEIDFENDDIGSKIVNSNNLLLQYFIHLGIQASARTVSVFIYCNLIRPHWDKESEDDYVPWGGLKTAVKEETVSDPSIFYMESQLEDFIIENWDRTEFGIRYDLIEENGELVSQQYKTDIGKIDILAKDKNTNQYVVIELKKDQTSDDTVGQLARYMGWVEEKKSNGRPAKGIIIAAKYDERLYYALRKIKDTEIYLYKVDFKLEEFRK